MDRLDKCKCMNVSKVGDIQYPIISIYVCMHYWFVLYKHAKRATPTYKFKSISEVRMTSFAIRRLQF